MRFIFASLAYAQAEECFDETVLLQVKTKQDSMGGFPNQGDIFDAQGDDIFDAQGGDLGAQGDIFDAQGGVGGAQGDIFDAQGGVGGAQAGYQPTQGGFGGEQPQDDYQPTQGGFGGEEYPPMNASTNHTEDGHGKDMDEIANVVADEFNLPVDAVTGFMDQMFPGVFEEFEMGDASFIEEVILDFCEENGGDNCHDLAAMATEHILEEFHDHQEENHDHQGEDHDHEEEIHDHEEEVHHHQEEFHLSDCEEQSTWPYWHCDEVECYEMGDHIHMNDVQSCEMIKECGPEDWNCNDKAWQSTMPVCQYPNMKTVFGDHPSGIPTVAERPDGPPDNVCMLEHHCIEQFGWDHIDNNGWGDVDSCVCDQFHGVEINREPHDSWHVDYFQNYCNPHDGHHDDAEYPADFYNSADFQTLMQRISKMAKNGMGKKFLQKSGLSRGLNGKKAVKAFLKQALMKKVLPGMSGAAWGYPAEKANSNPTKPWLSYGTSSSPTKPWR